MFVYVWRCRSIPTWKHSVWTSYLSHRICQTLCLSIIIWFARWHLACQSSTSRHGKILKNVPLQKIKHCSDAVFVSGQKDLFILPHFSISISPVLAVHTDTWNSFFLMTFVVVSLILPRLFVCLFFFSQRFGSRCLKTSPHVFLCFFCII